MPSPLSLSKILKPRAGWYRGDFHAHTTFSDGYYDPPELVEVARSEGLDFFTITDHNTINAFSHCGQATDILVVPGIEVTLKEGHFNIFGIEEHPDWLKQISTGEKEVRLQGDFDTFSRLMQQSAGESLLNSINHPLLVPWSWLDEATDLGNLHCLEIWNDPSWSDNAQANPQTVDLWTQWLNTGYRITAIGGTDYHQPQLKPGYKAPQRLSLPSTYVYAEEFSGAAILAGLRQRRAYVSMGPEVAFQAKLDGKTYDIGADLGEQRGEIILNATIFDAPAQASAQIIKNGRVVAEQAVKTEPTNFQYTTEIDPTRSEWYRLDVYEQDGLALVITNPIFVGPRPEPACYTYGEFIPAGNRSN